MDQSFLKSGGSARGDNFIGHENTIKDIVSEIGGEGGPINMALIGVNRIGTSSLAWHTIFDRTDLSNIIVPIWIRTVSYGGSSNFCKTLIDCCVRTMGELSLLESTIEDSSREALNALQPSDPWTPWESIYEFFAKVKATKRHILFILDRFDRVRDHLNTEKDVYANDTFNCLRELAIGHDYPVNFVLTSRLRIDRIGHKTNSVSPWFTIFNHGTIRLGMFCEGDIETYFSDILDIAPFSEEAKKHVHYYCGGHPYLLKLLCSWIIPGDPKVSTGQIDRDAIDAAVKLDDIQRYYEELIKLLQDVGIFDALLQLLFGSCNVEKKDVRELQDYDLITRTEDGTWRTFSGHFHEYLKENFNKFQSEMQREQLGDDLFAIWQDTEAKLREMIRTGMHSRYGEDWIDCTRHAAIKSFKSSCQNYQKQSIKQLGENRSDGLITFSGPSDTMRLIVDETLWAQVFEGMFGQDRGYWMVAKTILGKCRHPYAHSNADTILRDYERLLFEGFCKHILSIHKNWKKNPPPISNATTDVERLSAGEKLDQSAHLEISLSPSADNQPEQSNEADNQHTENSVVGRVANSTKGNQSQPNLEGTAIWFKDDLRIKPNSQEATEAVHQYIQNEPDGKKLTIHADGIIVPNAEVSKNCDLNENSCPCGTRVGFNLKNKKPYKNWRLEAHDVTLINGN